IARLAEIARSGRAFELPPALRGRARLRSGALRQERPLPARARRPLGRTARGSAAGESAPARRAASRKVAGRSARRRSLPHPGRRAGRGSRPGEEAGRSRRGSARDQAGRRRTGRALPATGRGPGMSELISWPVARAAARERGLNPLNLGIAAVLVLLGLFRSTADQWGAE